MIEDLDSKQIGNADWNFKRQPPELICMWCIADCFGNTLISKWIWLQHNSVFQLLCVNYYFFLYVLLSLAIFIHRVELKDKCVSHDYLLNYEMEHFRIRLHFSSVASLSSTFLINPSPTSFLPLFLFFFFLPTLQCKLPPSLVCSYVLMHYTYFIFSFLRGCNTDLNLTLSWMLNFMANLPNWIMGESFTRGSNIKIICISFLV